MVVSPVEVNGWGSALVTSEMWHESNGCSTLTAAYVADVVRVGFGIVYELVVLAAGTILQECSDAIIFKLGNSGKASSAPWRSRLCSHLPSCPVDAAPFEVWLQNVLQPFHWTACRTLSWIELPVEQRFWKSVVIHADHVSAHDVSIYSFKLVAL